MLYNRQKSMQHLFNMGFNLVSDICYLSAQSMKFTEFKINTQETLKNTPLIDHLLSSKNKQTQLFTDSATMTFSPVLPAPRPHFVKPTTHPPNHQPTRYQYLPEVRLRGILRTSVAPPRQHPTTPSFAHPTAPTNSQPVVSTLIPCSTI